MELIMDMEGLLTKIYGMGSTNLLYYFLKSKVLRNLLRKKARSEKIEKSNMQI
jgi:hypothetical protein